MTHRGYELLKLWPNNSEIAVQGSANCFSSIGPNYSAPLVNFRLPKLLAYVRPTSCMETEIGAVRPRSNALPIPRSIVARGHELRRRE